MRSSKPCDARPKRVRTPHARSAQSCHRPRPGRHHASDLRRGNARADRLLPAAHAAAAAAGHDLGDAGLRAAVRRARHALEHDRRLAADEPLRLALALQRPRRTDLHHLRLQIRSVADRRRRARHQRDRVRLRDDVERRLHAGRSGAAVVLDQGPRADRRIVVRVVHGGVRRVVAVLVQGFTASGGSRRVRASSGRARPAPAARFRWRLRHRR